VFRTAGAGYLIARGTLPSNYGRRREGVRIFTSVSTTSPVTGPFEIGATPGAGTFFCVDCGSQLSLQETDALPECPRCGGVDFRRDSIFESMQEHGEQTAEFALPAPQEASEWLREARALLPRPGRYLVCCEDADDEIQVFPLEAGWTRIGRSVTADIRLDDPSVSRRHALIVSERPDALRVLDDRSLNGVFLNGDLIEWARLADGDELTIGRYRLFSLTR
jgi:predicted RNA-binding Zn-ribbon protein involved in translation (DUF1610 family)